MRIDIWTENNCSMIAALPIELVHYHILETIHSTEWLICARLGSFPHSSSHDIPRPSTSERPISWNWSVTAEQKFDEFSPIWPEDRMHKTLFAGVSALRIPYPMVGYNGLWAGITIHHGITCRASHTCKGSRIWMDHSWLIDVIEENIVVVFTGLPSSILVYSPTPVSPVSIRLCVTSTIRENLWRNLPCTCVNSRVTYSHEHLIAPPPNVPSDLIYPWLYATSI